MKPKVNKTIWVTIEGTKERTQICYQIDMHSVDTAQVGPILKTGQSYWIGIDGSALTPLEDGKFRRIHDGAILVPENVSGIDVKNI